MNQLKADEWLLAVARETAKNATCARRSVGCVLANERNQILATGFNGPPRGLPHCTAESPSDRKALIAGTGLGLDLCQAVHAEQNALLQCRDVYQIESCFSTTAPCLTCTKLLLNTSCRAIYHIEDYPQAEMAKALWEGAGRVWAARMTAEELR